ncbi:MAG: class I SAM-dependent methyltransferase, partial [Candidatus Eremiobacteraeota bacterium]|nr:class I SAM-dependent methyltransferase [Candidatus Eremiobacteraeota bacterium]
GPGQWLYYVAVKTHGTAVGLDIAADSLERVRSSPALAPFIAQGRVKLIEGDIRATPLSDNTFDLVFSFGVIEHVRSDQSQLAVHEFKRLLRPGGRAFITTPNIFCAHTITRPIAKMLGRWTVGYERSLRPVTIARYANEAGLLVEECGVLDTGQLFGEALSTRFRFLEHFSHQIERAQSTLGFISYCIAKKHS